MNEGMLLLEETSDCDSGDKVSGVVSSLASSDLSILCPSPGFFYQRHLTPSIEFTGVCHEEQDSVVTVKDILVNHGFEES